MNEKTPKDIPKENIERLIASSVSQPEPEFQRKLRAAVLDELRERPILRRNRPPQTLRWAAALLTAAAVLVAFVVWSISDMGQRADFSVEEPGSPAVPGGARHGGQVRNLYGLVFLQNGQSPQQVDKTANVEVGQWVETHSGSEAVILLPDDSEFAVRPRSRVQIADKSNGARLVMQRGRLRLDVAKQPPGESLTVETPGAKITVLGTRLDVHVVQKPDGRKQTRVSVFSGEVELESAGRKVSLLPNMEGVANDGEPPRTRSLTAEVNEVIHLVEKTKDLAAESNLATGHPSIVEFYGDGSATIWTVLVVPNTTEADLRSYTFSYGTTTAAVEAYSLDGARLPVVSAGDAWQVDMSMAPVPPGGEAALIVELSDVEGVFQDRGFGTHEFASPTNSSGKLSLVQFRLPASARIEQLSPEPIETRKTLSRLLITVAVDGQISDILF
jgi:ferric-dicitrate binding protein FerR (iron transport regulator)